MKVEAITKIDPLTKGPKKKIKGLDMEYCSNCGKSIIFSAFMLRSNYRYVYNKKGSKKYCCGYSCYCIETN